MIVPSALVKWVHPAWEIICWWSRVHKLIQLEQSQEVVDHHFPNFKTTTPLPKENQSPSEA